MANSIFDTVRNNPEFNSKNAWTWFQYNVRQIGEAKVLKNAPMNLLTDNQTLLVNKLLPGYMYMFFYDPKLKKTLPYYDTFPLVIPFSMDANSFHGLNLHYLPIRYRFLLLTKLLSFANDPTMSDKTRLITSWRLLSNVSKFPEVAPCVKMYLKGHVKSKFLKIKPSDMQIACALPVERFKGAENDHIWKQSRELIGK